MSNQQVVQIAVTQDDIDHGVGRACRGCPISRAIGRHLGYRFYAYVCPYIAFVDDDRVGIFIRREFDRDIDFRIECTDEITEFAMTFDDWDDWQTLCDDEQTRMEYRKDRGMDDDEIPAAPWEFGFDLKLPKEYLLVVERLYDES